MHRMRRRSGIIVLTILLCLGMASDSVRAGNSSSLTGVTAPISGAPEATSQGSSNASPWNAASLYWIAPGDDGMVGRACAYDVRYATYPITAENFSSTVQVTGLKTPDIAGTRESCVVFGLTAGTTYWFAIKAVDESGNWSAISNVVAKTTMLAMLSITSPVVFQCDVNNDRYNDLVIGDLNLGNYWVALRDTLTNGYLYNTVPVLTNFHSGSSTVAVVADLTHDGWVDIVVGDLRPNMGRWWVASNTHLGTFAQVQGPYAEGSWLNGWAAAPSGFKHFAADVTNDGWPDLVVFEYSLGRLYVAGNTHANSFAQVNGTKAGGAWLDGWAASTGFDFSFADVTNDGWLDLCAFERAIGRLYVAGNTHANSFAQVNGTKAGGAWLDGWAASVAFTLFMDDVTPDGWPDLTAWEFPLGRWYTAVNQRNSTFTQLSGVTPEGAWLDRWGISSIRSPKLDAQELDTLMFHDSLPIVLEQSYPNPCNPTTTIAFYLNQITHASLVVHNVLGQQVSVLVDANLGPGHYQYEWNGSTYASGVYFYRLTTSTGEYRKKMLLIK